MIFKEFLQRSRRYSSAKQTWKGKTRTRVGSQKCRFAIMHFPEWRVLAKWTTLSLNIGTQLPTIPAQTHGSHCKSILRGRMATMGLLCWVYPGWILQCLTSVGTTRVLLVICPCVNFTQTSLFAFPFVAFLWSSLNSQYMVVKVCFKSVDTPTKLGWPMPTPTQSKTLHIISNCFQANIAVAEHKLATESDFFLWSTLELY